MEETDKIKRGYALKELNQLPAWSYVEQIFLDLYIQNMEKLVQKEDEGARQMCKALDEIYSKIKNGVKVGELAREKFKNKFKGV